MLRVVLFMTYCYVDVRFKEELTKLEENHDNEVTILESTIDEKQKFIENLERRITNLENENSKLESEKEEIKVQSLKNEELIINAAEEKIDGLKAGLIKVACLTRCF